MKQHLAVTAIGSDRPGLLHEFVRTVADCGGSISESRMLSLGQEFGLQLLVSGNWHAIARLEKDLARLGEGNGLHVHLKRTEARGRREDHIPYSIDVVCLDQPGIVAGLTGFFTSRGVEIGEVATRRRIFVLDTNVLMHDPTAIFRFEEHDIYLPMVVLEELDAGKKGLSEAARNVRQVSRFLDELMATRPRRRSTAACRCRPAQCGAASAVAAGACSSRPVLTRRLPELPGHGADNAILGADAGAAARASRRARHAGVEGHQPAHQGRDPRRARRGLLQRPDDRGRRPAVHRRAGAAADFWERTARTCSRGRKARTFYR
jgi:glycine cleavage system transcriptional repressor